MRVSWCFYIRIGPTRRAWRTVSDQITPRRPITLATVVDAGSAWSPIWRRKIVRACYGVVYIFFHDKRTTSCAEYLHESDNCRILTTKTSCDISCSRANLSHAESTFTFIRCQSWNCIDAFYRIVRHERLLGFWKHHFLLHHCVLHSWISGAFTCNRPCLCFGRQIAMFMINVNLELKLVV